VKGKQTTKVNLFVKRVAHRGEGKVTIEEGERCNQAPLKREVEKPLRERNRQRLFIMREENWLGVGESQKCLPISY